MTKNPNYRKFLDEGEIQPVTEDQLRAALANAGKSRLPGARALLITLYYTGCRPAEALKLRAKDISRDGHYIIVRMPAAKRSLARPIYLRDLELPRELWKYAMCYHPDTRLFFSFRNSYTRTCQRKNGEVYTRVDTTDKLRKHIPKWFKGVIEGTINPYFLRHSRFSKLAASDASEHELRQLKGSKTSESIMMYVHLLSKDAKKIAKKMV